MKCHLILGIGDDVHGFHEVDFAVGWPVGRICEPKSRPRRAAHWSVQNIEDKKPCIILRFGGDADGESTRGGIRDGLRVDCGIHLKDCRCCGGRCEVILSRVGCLRRYIVDKSICRIVACKIVEVIEKRGPRIC